MHAKCVPFLFKFGRPLTHAELFGQNVRLLLAEEQAEKEKENEQKSKKKTEPTHYPLEVSHMEIRLHFFKKRLLFHFFSGRL